MFELCHQSLIKKTWMWVMLLFLFMHPHLIFCWCCISVVTLLLYTDSVPIQHFHLRCNNAAVSEVPASLITACLTANVPSKFRSSIWLLAAIIFSSDWTFNMPTRESDTSAEIAVQCVYNNGHAHPVGGRTRRTSSAWPPEGRLHSRPSPGEPGHPGSGWPAGHEHRQRDTLPPKILPKQLYFHVTPVSDQLDVS